MEQIEVNNGIKLLVRNPNDLFSENFIINFSGSNNGYKPKKERAEFVSGISYPETIELGQSDVEQLSLFPNTPYTFDLGYLNSFKRKGEIKITSRSLSSGKVFSSRLPSLDDLVTGSEIFGHEDRTYLLFGSMLNYIAFLDILNNKLKKKLIEAQEYLDVVERVSCIFHHMYAYSWVPYVVHRATVLPIHKEILRKDTLLKRHTTDLEALQFFL